ncbi:THUMP-like domain-containing protein [Dyadobacter sp. CY326]|uniref:THUMP-like domain-containing protein n=1 Tax=Dyadobacter sp. CY326 TaxID=2907300 RepID=UPI001F199663|nr:hypothetical protein [Dyadobacter sp. CY326]MCE7066889.1 hypothetical protein [Dyadobacter sp. CY326]
MSDRMPESSAAETSFSQLEIDFIKAHMQDDVSQLMLRAGQFKGYDIKKLAAQIQSRQKAVKKLPQWSANPALTFPPALSVEQSSSEGTARYKASIVSGNQLIDITGGMGVDCFYMSQKFEQVQYFEQQAEVAATAKANFKHLGVTNIVVHAENSLENLAINNLPADWIYADPARRNANREKVVLLSGCTPDIVSNLDLLFQNAPQILLKTSPLLDIDLAAKSLKYLKEVHVIGFESECKELLFVMDLNHASNDFEIKIRIVDGAGAVLHRMDFNRETERISQVTYSDPLQYLYEPHAAVLKAGAFKTVSAAFSLDKLSINSQLYTSHALNRDFPGRTFEIIAVCKPDIKEIAKHIQGDKANLTVRNFPAKSEELRKKWKLKDGGKYYLFATTLADNSKVVVVTMKPEMA